MRISGRATNREGYLNVSTIRSKDCTIQDLLHDFYVVPDYQREYVWKTKQVDQFLNDIYEGLTLGSAKEREYFIGNIVVCPKSSDEYEVIDGQQRITTIYISQVRVL